MKKLCLFFGIMIIISSCELKDKKCIRKLKDERTLNEYYVQIDSCDKWKGHNYYEYYSSKGLVMSGYGDRLRKQGNWTFFNNDNKIISGEFEDGKPSGDWKSDIVEIRSWKLIKGADNFEVSIPSSWWFENNESSNFNIVTSIDKASLQKVNFNIVVTNYDIPISDYIFKHNDTLKNSGIIKELDFKELSIEGFKEAFQRKFKIKQNSSETLIFQTFLGKEKLEKVFVITQSSRYDLYRKYEPYLNAMANSIRIYE